MRSTFKLLFFVKRNAVKKNGNAPIIARITIDQIVAQFNTQMEINPVNWSNRQKCRSYEYQFHVRQHPQHCTPTLSCFIGTRRLCDL